MKNNFLHNNSMNNLEKTLFSINLPPLQSIFQVLANKTAKHEVKNLFRKEETQVNYTLLCSEANLRKEITYDRQCWVSKETKCGWWVTQKSKTNSPNIICILASNRMYT